MDTTTPQTAEPSGLGYETNESASFENEVNTPESGQGPETERPLDYECLKSKGMNFIHLNTRSLLPKLDELRLLASNTKVAVIGITESWLDASVTDAEVEIPGYLIVRHDRNRTGGGVCLYIRSDIAFNPKNDIGADLETVWAELYLPKTKPILVGVCYRPPKQMDFFSLLEQSCLNCNNFSNSECIILGDFNTDNQHINCKTNQLHVSLKHCMSMFDLSQLISNPTRITSTTSTILDLIIVSDPIKINKCGVSDLGVSDHLLIYCTRKCKKVPVNDHNGVKLRSLKNYTKEAFEGKLQQVDWQEVGDKL